MPEMYEPTSGGQEYNVPVDGDVADAPLAFKNFSESMPPEYVPVDTISATYEVVKSDNGKILVAAGNSDVTFATDLPEGFNVALTLSSAGTITLNGVVGETSIPFEKIGSVVKAGTVLYSSVSIGEIIEVEGASGGPLAPTSITVDGNVVTSGPSGEGDGGPTLAYGAKVTSELEGDAFTWELQQPADPILNGPEVVLLDTTPFVNYQVEIFGLNVAGRGEGIVSEKFQINYNEATGGTETIVDNYNGTTEKWKVHTFTASDATGLTVTQANEDFRVLAVAAGGGGHWTGAGGGEVIDSLLNIPVDTHDVTIGVGGQAYTPGTNTSLGDVVEARGGNQGSGRGGAGGASGNGNAGTGGGGGGAGEPANSANGGLGIYSDASGVEVGYGGGAGCGGPIGAGSTDGSGAPGRDAGGRYNAPPNRGGGGGGSGSDLGGVGGSGLVIVAYQIGTSTTREIAQAQAEQEARAAGVEQGIEQGKVEGYAQAQEDLNDVIEAGRTALQTAVEQDTMIIDGKEQPVKRRRRK